MDLQKKKKNKTKLMVVVQPKWKEYRALDERWTACEWDSDMLVRAFALTPYLLGLIIIIWTINHFYKVQNGLISHIFWDICKKSIP